MLSPGAYRMLAFLRNRGAAGAGCWWFQENIAKALGISVRTVRRHVADLVDAGLVDSKRRGSTSNLYALRQTRGKQLVFESADVPSDRPKMAGRRKRISITESSNTEEAGSRSFSSEEIEHPGVQEALRKARSRIQRAQNPEAYQAAIIRRTLESFASARQGWVSGLNHAALNPQFVGSNPTPCSALAKEAGESVSGEVAASFFSPSNESAGTLRQPLEQKQRFGVAHETVSRFVRDEELEGLEEFIAQHERAQTALIGRQEAGDVYEPSRVATQQPDCPAINTALEVTPDVQPMQRPRLLRRAPGRSLCRAVEVNHETNTNLEVPIQRLSRYFESGGGGVCRSG